MVVVVGADEALKYNLANVLYIIILKKPPQIIIIVLIMIILKLLQ